MNRRNVLGNQIEESKTTWVVTVSLLVSILQLVLYVVMDGNWVALLLSGLGILLGGILVHFITGELGELFPFLLIPCIISGGAGLLIPQLKGEWLPQSTAVLVGCLLAWLVPVVYACLFTWAEGSTVLPQFSAFYKKAAIFFYLVYFGILIYWFMVYCRIPEQEVTLQMIPFASFAAYIDGIISETVPVQRLLQYLLERILLFLPYGFFIAMVGRKLHSMLRLGLVLVLPVIVELLQYLLKYHSCDADDVIFAFLGGMFGMLLFVIFNVVFQKTTGKNFDGSEVERDYYGRKI